MRSAPQTRHQHEIGFSRLNKKICAPSTLTVRMTSQTTVHVACLTIFMHSKVSEQNTCFFCWCKAVVVDAHDNSMSLSCDLFDSTTSHLRLNVKRRQTATFKRAASSLLSAWSVTTRRQSPTFLAGGVIVRRGIDGMSIPVPSWLFVVTANADCKYPGTLV